MHASYIVGLGKPCDDKRRLSHESAAMPLKCYSWQSLREYIRRLVISGNLVEPDLRLRAGRKLPHPVHTRINVLARAYMPLPFRHHEKYARVVIMLIRSLNRDCNVLTRLGNARKHGGTDSTLLLLITVTQRLISSY